LVYESVHHKKISQLDGDYHGVIMIKVKYLQVVIGKGYG